MKINFRSFSVFVALFCLWVVHVAHADEVTITPVYNSLSSGIGRSYIRLFNPSYKTDATATLRILSSSGAELARLSLLMPRVTSKQYELSELEYLASPKITPTSAAAYIIKVSTVKDSGAYVQHVIYNDKANTFTNASACDTGRARTHYMINVHTPKIGALGYESLIAIQNDGAGNSRGPYLAFNDAGTGRNLGFLYLGPLKPQEMRVYKIETLLDAANIKLTDQDHINVTLTRQSEFSGFISHSVNNTKSGMHTNMAEMCNIPQFSPDAVTAPSAQFSESGYFTKSINISGILIRGSRLVRTSSLNEMAPIVNHMLSKRGDIKGVLVSRSQTLTILGREEEKSELPFFAHTKLKTFTQTLSDGTVLIRDDDGVRGSGGASLVIPEDDHLNENLKFKDPADSYMVAVHEFAHSIHSGIEVADPNLWDRIKKGYDSAMTKGLWKGVYSSVNEHEWFAMGTQVWFQVSSANTGSNNKNQVIKFRAELKAYDPELNDILALVFPAEYIPTIPHNLNPGETAQSAQERATDIDSFLPPEEMRNTITYR